MKLVMLKIGARPQGRLIEQHDVCFCAVNCLADVIGLVNQHWPEVKNRWHIDAWRTVTQVDDYLVSLEEHGQVKQSVNSEHMQLFFINLGGYQAQQFEEFHHQILTITASMAQARSRAKRSDFYQNYNLASQGRQNSCSHIDDQYAIDIDEIYAVQDLIDPALRLVITKVEKVEQDLKHYLAPDSLHQDTVHQDILHIGYLPIKQIKSMTMNL